MRLPSMPEGKYGKPVGYLGSTVVLRPLGCDKRLDSLFTLLATMISNFDCNGRLERVGLHQFLQEALQAH